jgi:hypothetical protein
MWYNMKWQDEIKEHLVNLHPHEIIEGIIKPSIDQVISDFEDYKGLCVKRSEEARLNRLLLDKWKKIRRNVDDEDYK